MRKFLLAAFAVITSFSAFSQDFSNKGKDFWVGYGYHQVMGAGNGQDMVLYFACDQATTVTISIPSVSYTEVLTGGPGNSILTSTPLPKAGTQDARLTVEGLNDRGIHIVATKPVVAYAHIYNASVSGASILYPTNTLGKEYYSINYKNISNSAASNCWFYVVAVDPGTTTVEITPSASTTGGWAGGTTYTVSLTQGQIYNVMGNLTSSSNPFNGVDLTGSKIKSVAVGVGECKRIAVFSGSGRISTSCPNTASSSSDNYMVQSLPKSAWGKKFLTVPAAGYNNNATPTPYALSFFRVCVSDPTTIVKLNGSVMSGLTNSFYYEFGQTNIPNLIEADKPITVAQYFTSAGACGNPGADGDPEVIYLSPVEQNINKVQWNACAKNLIKQNKHYISLVIPNAGTAISSMQLDGVTVNAAAFIVHPFDGNFSYAIFNVTGNPPGGLGFPHTLTSDSGFNAIAYGYGAAESYGYNAGTNIKDLYQQVGVNSPYSIDPDPSVCTGSPFQFKISLPYLADSIYWDLSGLPAATTIPTPTNLMIRYPPNVPDSSTIVSGKTIYWYSYPATFTISPAGAYPISITAYAPNPDGCGNSQDRDFTLNVFDPQNAMISMNSAGCVNTAVQFNDNTSLTPKPPYLWTWNFGDATTSNAKNPTHIYTAPGVYNVTLNNITTAGCFNLTGNMTVTITNKPTANFTASSPVCEGAPVTFTDNSTLTGGVGSINNWNWNFGDLTTATGIGPQVHTYATYGDKVPYLVVKSTGNCPSDTFKINPLHVNPKPNAVIGALPSICLPYGSSQFTSNSTIAEPSINQYYWTFGDGGTATVQNPTHQYLTPGPLPFDISLAVMSAAGCKSDTVHKSLNTVYPQGTAGINTTLTACVGEPHSFISTSDPGAGSTFSTFSWNFGDGFPSSTVTNGSSLAVYIYTNPGTYTVTHWITSDHGCNSDTASVTIVISTVPSISSTSHTNPTTCLGSNGTITLSGLQAGKTYTVNYNKNSIAQPTLTLTADASGNVVITGLTAGSYTTFSATNNNCTGGGGGTQVLTDPAAPTAPNPGSNQPICSGNTLTLTASNVAGATTYTWTGPNAFNSSLQNPTIVAATTAASGIYNVTVTVANCVSAPSTNLNVVVNATPVISSVIPTNPSTCSGSDGSITINGLTAGQSFTINYQKNSVAQPPLAIVANASGSVTISNLTAGSYSNINVTANGCTSTDAPTQLLSDPNPPAAPAMPGSNAPVCSGTTLSLTTSNVGGATYAWAGPNSFTSALQNPTIPAVTVAASGNYTVTITVANCTSAPSTPLNVVVNPTPAISSLSKVDPTTCLGSNGTITINGLTAGQNYTVNYQKNTVAQPPVSLTATAGGSVTITGLTAGSYSNINVTLNGCTSGNGATQVLNDPAPPPAPNPGSNQPICSGNTLTLSATNVAGATTYTWTGPNSFSSSLQNPSIVAATTAASGIYNVTATVNNCVSAPSVNLNVVVNLTPTISSVTFTNPTTCSGANGTITLNGLTAGQTFTINYQKNSVAQAPLSLTANAAGSVTITNLTSGSYSNINATFSGCTGPDAATQVLTDPNPPAAPNPGGTSSNSPICAGATLTLNTPSVAGGTFTWTGPNSFSAAVQNPTIPNATVAANGNYSVTVTVANCVSAATVIPVVINANPTAAINNSTPVCLNVPVNFTDASVANSGALNGWTWSFGDASPNSIAQNPSHPYTATGSFTVTLTVTTDKGCTSTPVTKQLTVNPNPTAGFMIPEVCLNDIDATFTDTSHPTGSITGWLWTFGDPGSGPLNTQNNGSANGVHKYTNTGNFPVTLTATNNFGCTNSITQSIFINGANPTANYTVTNQAILCSNDSVAIINTSSVVPGVITKLEIYWDNIGAPVTFDVDDNPFTNKQYKHKYPTLTTTQNYTIRMRAYSGTLCVNDKLTVITVNATPKVQFNNMPPVCLSAAPFQITQASETGGVPGTGTFSGPGVSASGIFNPVTAGIGTFLIKYTYTSTAAGCTDTLSRPITVLDTATARFAVTPPACETKTVTFTDQSTTPTGTTLSNTVWDFGDGSALENHVPGSSFTHVYQGAGTYTVTMYNTNSQGCKSTNRITQVVVAPQARPNFTFPASVCLPAASVLFTNASTIADGTENSFTYLWNFGDPGSGASNTSVSKNPTHVYSAMGPYTVQLQVTTGAGCYHDTTITVNNIHPQPKAAFSISNPPGVCIGDPITFTDNSNPVEGTISSWHWDLGDATKPVTPVVVYTYATANTYNVSLYITNSIGCNSDTLVKPFTVHPYPTVDAGPDRFILEGGRITLQPVVTGNDLTYLWTPPTFLNNNTLAKPDVVKPTIDITYKLTVTARGGCSKSDFVFVKLLKFPVIPNTFTPNNDGINDFWSIDYLNTYPDNRVQVFNRYGQLIFESYGYSKPWDGTYNGKTLPVGTYYYIIEPKNGREPLTGYVTILK